jgi:hypothetical protein
MTTTRSKKDKKRATAFCVGVAIAIWALVGSGCSNSTPAPASTPSPHRSVSVVDNNPDQPVQVKQPETAADVAKDLHGTHFVNKKLGDARVMWGMTSGGTFMLHGVKYGVNVFNSPHLMRVWLKVAKQYGVNPKWETHNAVVYPSLLG